MRRFGTVPLFEKMKSALEDFEEGLKPALREATGIDRKVMEVLKPIPIGRPTRNVPKDLREISAKVGSLLGEAEKVLSQQREEWRRSRALVDQFKNSFLVVLAGRVKQGKTSLCDCLARLFETGLKRQVSRFRIDEPTRYVSPSRQADFQETLEIYVPDLHDQLKADSRLMVREVWERLKREHFRLTPERAEDLRDLGIQKVAVPIAGDYIVRPITEFEIDALEVPKMQGFISGGLAVLDAPGLSSGNPYAQERAREMWAAADVVVYLSSRDAPLQATDLDHLKTYASGQDRSILFVITKCDRYEEDEEDGQKTGRRYFGVDVFKEQREFVRNTLQQKGLSHLLSDKTIFGLSSKLFQERLKGHTGEMAIQEAIVAGHFQEFLERLLYVLTHDGLRRKKDAPLKQVGRLARDLRTEFTQALEKLDSLKRNDFSRESKHANKAVEEFKEMAMERLQRLLDERFAAAQARVGRDKDATIQLRSDEVKKIFRETAVDAARSYAASLMDALEQMALPGLSGTLKEKWDDVIQTVRKKIGRSKTGQVLGRGTGSIAGGVVGLWIGNMLFPGIGGGIGFLLGSAAGGLAGSRIGSVFGKDIYHTTTITKPVRQGDNFEKVRGQLNARLERVVAETAQEFRKRLDHLLTDTARWIDEARQEIARRIEHLENLERLATKKGESQC